MAFNLPAIEYPRNALLDFSPLSNAINRYQQASENAYDFGVAKKAGEFAQKGELNNAALEAFKGGLPDLGAKFQGLDQSKKQFDLDYQHKIAQATAGLAQMAQNEPDPNKRAAMTQRILGAHPSFTQSIKDKLPAELQNDHDTVLKYIIASASGYKDPLEQAHKRAQIANLNSQAPLNAAHAELYRAQAQQANQKPQGQLKEVNGKLVWVSPNGQEVKEVYNAGPDLSKTPEHVAKSANFAARMIDAEENLQAASKDPKKYDPTTLGTAIVNATPEWMANYYRTPEGQKYMQSAKQWIRAYLRRESGAAISADEFKQDFITFFPQPNEGPEVIEQKRQARMLAAQGIANEARDVFGHLAPRQAEVLKKWNANAPQAPDANTPTITNPKTGQRMKLQNGQWVPL